MQIVLKKPVKKIHRTLAKKFMLDLFYELEEYALENHLKRFNRFITKVRFFEGDKSYEDFSVAVTKDEEFVFNFSVVDDTENNKLIIKKKSSGATKHITFDNSCTMTSDIKIVNRTVILCVYIDGEIMYTDGTHRYNSPKLPNMKFKKKYITKRDKVTGKIKTKINPTRLKQEAIVAEAKAKLGRL